MTLCKSADRIIRMEVLKMPRDDTRPKKIFIKNTAPKKIPPMPDYGGKPPGAKPLAPKPESK